ncbi:MAG: hypothetical protein LBV42_03300 [Methanobrevibacter sp.]|jgi:hypothetical protein|nr:hypothetical protein [Methanobrevibacter sp.]
MEIKIENSLFNIISQKARKQGISKSKLINEILKKESSDKESAIERIEILTNEKAIILNKNIYNPSNVNIIVGIADAPKEFDSVTAVNDLGWISRNK